MRHYLTCLWPGLAELWWRGRLSALPVAIGFMVAVNVILVTRYIYPSWLPAGLVSMAFWVGLLAWAFAAVRSIRELPGLVAPRSISDQPDRFPEAHQAFLNADYAAAEKWLAGVLAIEPRDPPALLLLVAVYRLTGRLESAEILLSEIRRLEVADRWHLEVTAETRRLERATQRAVEKAEEAEEAEQAQTSGTADLAHEGDNPARRGEASADEPNVSRAA